MQVDAIEKRPADLSEIALDDSSRAAALACRIAVKTARTWIHRPNKHEIGGERKRRFGAGERYRAFLERLAQQFENIARKLGQLVEEEHAMVSEAHFTRAGRPGAAA